MIPVITQWVIIIMEYYPRRTIVAAYLEGFVRIGVGQIDDVAGGFDEDVIRPKGRCAGGGRG